MTNHILFDNIFLYFKSTNRIEEILKDGLWLRLSESIILMEGFLALGKNDKMHSSILSDGEREEF